MIYTAEKASRLLLERCVDPILNEHGFIICNLMVNNDIRAGNDGFSGETLQASPIHMFNREIKEFARCVRGEEFGEKVKTYLVDRNNFPKPLGSQ